MARQKRIYNAVGEKVLFKPAKVIKSLERAGASRRLAEDITMQVQKRVSTGMRTFDVYSMAHAELRRHRERPIAARYGLKQAILMLGPTGYPFEQFVAKILAHQGYETSVGVVVPGYCISHEVDVVAETESKHFMIECKFHNSQGHHNDVKVPLYIQSRFLDIKKKEQKTKGLKRFHQQWIVTNTRFSKDAIQYGTCVGLKLIGWRYPADGGLTSLVENTGLHPLTCLTTLTHADKRKLLEKKIVLCRDLLQAERHLRQIKMSESKIQKVLAEAKGVCG